MWIAVEYRRGCQHLCCRGGNFGGKLQKVGKRPLNASCFAKNEKTFQFHKKYICQECRYLVSGEWLSKVIYHLSCFPAHAQNTHTSNSVPGICFADQATTEKRLKLGRVQATLISEFQYECAKTTEWQYSRKFAHFCSCAAVEPG